MNHDKVFISYSHVDEEWKDLVVKHLGVLESEGRLEVWDDRRIAAGDNWYPEIERALANARVAILVISADFLISRFILEEEVPQLLKRRKEEGLRVIPLIVRPCAWKHISWLKGIQVRPRDGRSLSGGLYNEIEEDLTKLVDEVFEFLRESYKNSRPLDSFSESNPANVQPRYPNEHIRKLSEALEAAYEQQETLLSAGQDTTAITKKILSLKRKMRQGPQLKAGEILWDGRLKLLERLGSGGFATIWKAIDKKRHELVAILCCCFLLFDLMREPRFFFSQLYFQKRRINRPGLGTGNERRLGYHSCLSKCISKND